MAYPRYLDMRLRAPYRLLALKLSAEKLNKSPHRIACNAALATWRDVRYSGFHNASENCITLSRGYNTIHGTRYEIAYTHSGPAFGRECYADEIKSAHIDHTGWYADTYQCDTYRGIVARLPHGRFLVGYESGDSGERVYFLDVITGCEIEAARAADRFAERCAEQEREYHERWDAARDIKDEIETAVTRLRECLALRNHHCFARVRNEARELIASIRDNRETLKTEFSDIEV